MKPGDIVDWDDLFFTFRLRVIRPGPHTDRWRCEIIGAVSRSTGTASNGHWQMGKHVYLSPEDVRAVSAIDLLAGVVRGVEREL